MLFALASILVEAGFVFVQVFRLEEYSLPITIILRIAAFVLVLVIYSKNVTASMKMPWIILILLLPVFGTTLYIMVGINRGTKKMKDRFKEIDT